MGLGLLLYSELSFYPKTQLCRTKRACFSQEAAVLEEKFLNQELGQNNGIGNLKIKIQIQIFIKWMHSLFPVIHTALGTKKRKYRQPLDPRSHCFKKKKVNVYDEDTVRYFKNEGKSGVGPQVRDGQKRGSPGLGFSRAATGGDKSGGEETVQCALRIIRI